MSGCIFLTRQEGVVRFYVGIRVCDASTPRPHPVSRKSSSPVDPQSCSPVARQWPSIPPERLASGSRRVSRQSSWPVDPAQYPARAARQWIRRTRQTARQWIPPSIPPEQPASVAYQWIPQSIPSECSPVDPAKYPTRAARQWIPPSILLSWLAHGSRRASR